LIEQGMNAARLNFSHGTHESHAAAIKTIRHAADQRRAPVCIIQDLQGPRIRVGEVPGEGIRLEERQPVRLQTMLARSGGQLGHQSLAASGMIELPVTYRHLAQDVRPGSRILINDGLIELAVERINGGAIDCKVLIGGTVTSHKGINLPGTRVSAPTLTDKDRDDIRFGIAEGVDYVALSFVRGPDDIRAAKKLIAACGGSTPVIAKIERQEAMICLDAILEEADGVMIARGDLGVEMGPEAVPLLQKRIIAEANRRPTRAEASDVANAVFDGTDAVMLSAETAIGAHPVETVQVMDRIIRAAEEGCEPGMVPKRQSDFGNMTLPEAMCTAASSAAAATTASAIVAFSELGSTARLISKQRPAAPIIAFTPFEPIRRQMALYWGVQPHTMQQIAQTDERIHEAERRLKAEGLVKPGERIVILSGTRIGQPGGTNLIKLQEVE
jgi:pyruvate kinase